MIVSSPWKEKVSACLPCMRMCSEKKKISPVFSHDVDHVAPVRKFATLNLQHDSRKSEHYAVFFPVFCIFLPQNHRQKSSQNFFGGVNGLECNALFFSKAA